MKKYIIFFLILHFSVLTAQTALKSTEEEYFDFLSLQGLVERPTLGYRTLSDSVWKIPEGTEHVWQNNNLGTVRNLFESENQGNNWFTKGFFHGIKLKIYGPEWYNSFNTAAPYGQNDGALWQGRGYNTSLTGGARLEGYGFEITLKPMLTFSQNLEFEFLSGVYGNENSYFWTGSIDLVQRYGDKPYFQFDWNDSEIRYNFYNFTIGFGTQSFWLGSAKFNPMLGSNNAGGIPKLDFGFKKTKIVIPGLDWNLGYIESRVWIAQLTESDYFNNDGVKDKNLFNGFNISYSPPFWENMTIGATKVTLTKWGNNFWKYINPFYNDNDVYGIGEDQKASVYLDILIPQVGFNVYAEVGLDDYTSDPRSNFFHTYIYTVGLKKTFTIFEKYQIFGMLYAEANFFEMSQDFQLQWNYMGYYAHHQVKEGYTQKGQLISGCYGTFGNSQIIGFKVYIQNMAFELFFHRNVPDMNYLYNKAVNDVATNVNQFYGIIENKHTFGLKVSYFLLNTIILESEIDNEYIRHANFKKRESISNWRFTFDFKLLF